MTSTRSGGVPANHAQKLDRGTLLACCLAIGVAQMGVSLAAPLLGVIQRDLGASAAALAWIPAAFILPTAILELNFGVLGDMFGRKRLLVWGGVLIFAGDVVAGTSGTLTQLIAGQAIAGLGAAAIFPTSLAMLVSATPAREDRARAVSYWAVSLAFGAMIAPLIGGFAAEHFGWGWSFAVPAALGLVTAAVSALVIVDSRHPAGRGLDWPGQITIAVSLLALLYAVIQGSVDGFATPTIIAAFVIAITAGILFVVSERRARTPMLDLNLFRTPSFAAAAAIGLLAMFGFIGTAYALSVKLEAILHVGPLQAALPFALIQAVPLLLTPLLPRLLMRIAARTLLVTGLLALAIGQFWMAQLPGDSTSLLAMTGPILLLGTGFITMFTALTAVAVGAVDIDYAGMASAVTSLVRETGQSLGPAIVSAVAFGVAGATLTSSLSDGSLPPDVASVATGVNEQGGPLAVANADLGPVSDVVAPLARSALELGLDTSIYVCVGASVLAALIALVIPGGIPRSPEDPPFVRNQQETDMTAHPSRPSPRKAEL
ncbi:MFS transporter [Rhodococcus sp. EPR-157]|uniref:MFS transporter n=1 Tax=Rhodococcus sp. EPR-157 TaxID=1813677 RepID=UPI0009ED34DF|nr:MFS transporter [Rhodococcus sp. EPR-157]